MKVKTACPLDCWDACSLLATVENGVVTELTGDPDHPITEGVACSRGRRIRERAYSPHRVLHPMKKVNGAWVQIDWDIAMDEISERIKQVICESHHHAILHAYDWGSGTVLKNLNQRFFYSLGGCTETVGSLCWDAGLTAQHYDFGQARSHSPEDTARSKKIVVWGRNLSVTNMHMMNFVKRAVQNGGEIAVINPLTTDLDRRASLVVNPRPGTDAALALGLLRYCAEQGWLDRDFLTERSVGWDRMLPTLEEYTLEFVERETDVPKETIVKLARWYGESGPVHTLLGIGLQRYAGGGNTIRAIDALAAATGHVGVSGGGVNFANRWIPEFLDQDTLSGRDGADVREFTRGTQATDILQANPKIEMMFVTRTNSLSQVPNTNALIEAYRTIPTIVAMDMFMHATAEMADYFLPCTTVLEEEDISLSTMWHPYITYANRAVDCIGEAKSDYEIFAMLADRLGFGRDFRRPLDEWFEIVLKPLHKYGLGLADLKREGTLRLPLVDVPWKDQAFRTPSGKYEFISKVAEADGKSPYATYVRTEESRAQSVLNRRSEKGESGGLNGLDGDTKTEFPYALLSIHPRTSQNSQHKDWPSLPEYPIAEISGAIAKETGCVHGELALLATRRGTLRVKLSVRDGGHPYTVRMEAGWFKNGVGINTLTPSRKADFGQQTAQYDCACTLHKIK